MTATIIRVKFDEMWRAVKPRSAQYADALTLPKSPMRRDREHPVIARISQPKICAHWRACDFGENFDVAAEIAFDELSLVEQEGNRFPMAKPPSGKPSLIDASPSQSGVSHEVDTSIRMLDALDPARRQAHRAPVRRSFGWMTAALLLLAACGVSWSWWSHRSVADDGAQRGTRVGVPTPSATTSTVAESASAATIVETPAPPALRFGQTPTTASPVVAPAASAVVSNTSPSLAAASASVPLTASKPEWATPRASASTRQTRTTAATNDESRRATNGSANTKRSPAGNASSDSDVALLTAMLATMSRDVLTTAGGASSTQAQLTIAQLVQRCEMNGVKDAIETFECKRRICDGYWGKADACPMSLSPKKN